ncbi:hypothetical protein AL073_09330 [Loktanella sp. 1ANDIMAR09]|nr:hypothetical protein AL073_09330 [Loktanella sp. 1ANDIMAR09]
MKRICISLRALKKHEFRTTLRYIRATGATWHDIYVKLGDLQSKQTATLIKSCGGLFVYYLVLSSLGDIDRVGITLQGYSASVPTAFVTVVASVGLYFILLQAQTLVMVIMLRIEEGAKLSLRGFSMNAYGFYHDQDEMALAVPVLSFGSFQERLPTSRLLSLMLLIVVLALTIPLFGFWSYLLRFQLEIILSNDVQFIYRAVATFGVLMLVFSLVYLILFNVPMPFKKNTFAIRWGFLVRNYLGGNHPRIAHWLDEEVKKSL